MGESVLNTRYGALWVQPDGPNTAVHFLGCHDLGDISESAGAVDILRCMDTKGGWKSVGSIQKPPDMIKTSIENMHFMTRDWLEKINCEFSMYVNQRDGGEPDIFYNYGRANILQHCRITSRKDSGLVGTEEKETKQSRDIEAWPPVIRTGMLTARRLSTSETSDILCIAPLRNPSCTPKVYAGDQMVAGAKSTLYTGNVLITTDGGETWTATAADPFAVGVSVQSIVTVPMSGTTVRIIAAGAAPSGGQGEIAYSDDLGATWTKVNIGGATAGHGAKTANALFALDQSHIWLASALGYIYFSTDAGATWTVQNSDASTNDVLAIYFANENDGMAIMDTNTTPLITSNGGETWSDTAADISDNGHNVWKSGDYWWISLEATNNLAYSNDDGATWSYRPLGKATFDEVVFANDFVGYGISFNTNSTFHFTINGGYSWSTIALPVNTELLDLCVIDENTVYAVGVASGGTGVIIKLSWD